MGHRFISKPAANVLRNDFTFGTTTFDGIVLDRTCYESGIVKLENVR